LAMVSLAAAGTEVDEERRSQDRGVAECFFFFLLLFNRKTLWFVGRASAAKPLATLARLYLLALSPCMYNAWKDYFILTRNLDIIIK
jgi:hypothetical protein